MKKVILFITLVFSSFLVNAQAPLEEGNLQIDAGLGSSGWGTPVYVGLDYGIATNFTIGVEASYRSYTNYGYKSTIIGIQGNGNYHFNEILNIPSKWDFYAGLSLNYYIWSFDTDFANEVIDDSNFGVGAQIGGRYFFNDKIAINLEAGGGNATSGGKIGITYKF